MCVDAVVSAAAEVSIRADRIGVRAHVDWSGTAGGKDGKRQIIGWPTQNTTAAKDSLDSTRFTQSQAVAELL